MFEKLLSLLAEGRAWSLEDLAAGLNTNEADIKARIEFLEHNHMLRRVSMSCGCDHNCNGCSSVCEVSEFKLPVMWEVIK